MGKSGKMERKGPREKPSNKANEVQKDAEQKAVAEKEAQRKRLEQNAKLQEYMAWKVTSNGFDARASINAEGNVITVEMIEGGVVKYAIKMNAQEKKCILEKVNADKTRVEIDEGCEMSQIIFPVSDAALHSLTKRIVDGYLDKYKYQTTGDTEFTLTETKTEDGRDFHFEGKGTIEYFRDTPTFILRYHEKIDMYQLLTVQDDTLLSLAISRNPYNVINYNRSQLLSPLTAAQKKAGQCGYIPDFKPPVGKVIRKEESAERITKS